MGEKLILFFDQIRKKDVPLVGGKTASLGEMLSIGLPVPNGFAITAQAYKYFIRENKLDREIKRILRSTDTKNIKELKKTGLQIRNLIRNAKFSKNLERKIIKAFEKLNCKYVAVRSSATAEDLPSIAGNETVLVRLGSETKHLEVEKLFEELKENPKPVFVPSLTDDRKIKWIKIKELYQHPAKNKVLYKITTKSGREITITPDHSLVTLEPDEFKTKITSINKLDKNTRIPVIKHLPLIKNGQKTIDVKNIIKSRPTIIENGRVKIDQKNTLKEQYGLPAKIPIDKEFAYFLGIYLAEGSIYDKKGCIDISCESIPIANKVRRFYRSIDSYEYKKRREVQNIRVHNAILATFLRDIAGKPLPLKGKGRSARVKYVPEFIFSQSKQIIGEFLKGLFDGDGWVDNRSIGYTSLSRKLVGGVVKLLEMLEIKCYIEKSATTIIIPTIEAEKFKKLINFTEKRNQKKLEKLIKSYNKIEKHYDFIDTIPPSKKISELLEEKLKPNVKLERVKVVICPTCEEEMTKGGTYRDYKSNDIKIQRYHCNNCGFSPTERSTYLLKKRTVLKYIYYDELGQFKKGMNPWNKGNRKRLITYGISHLEKIAKKIKSKELLKIVNSDIIWDKVEKIEPVKYSGYVYDFVVPETQNFAAGLGGIITHNTASFAGQQESFLNVSEKDLLEKVKSCFASLFTDRAISYRQDKGFDHFKVYLSVAVQKQIFSKASGVLFTIDPDSGHKNFVVINSGFGLGDYIVQGKITPDEFWVFKETCKLVDKKLGKKSIMEIRSARGVKKKKLSKRLQNKFSIADLEAEELAKYGKIIEKHYGMAMDVEWAKASRLYIIQARPETVHIRRGDIHREYRLKERSKVLAEGLAIGRKIVFGKVNVILNPKNIGKFKSGVLVTKHTNPDWEPIMKIASGIVTQDGGRTSHCAIVARELGVPAIIGVKNATKIFKNNQTVTLDCSQVKGRIWKDSLKFSTIEHELKNIPETKTKILVNIGEPEEAVDTSLLPVDGVGLAREEFIISAAIGMHPLEMIQQNKQKGFIEKLSLGIAKIAASFYPRKVVVRLSDFKTNEYRSLKGGSKYEEIEDNPMIGFRGAARYIDKKFEPAFRLELKAIKKVIAKGLDNIKIMVPFCRTLEEAEKTLQIIKSEKLKAEIGVMAEIPSNIILADKFSKLFSFFSIGSNDLTQLVLGIDRDNETLAKEFDERNEAVKIMVRNLIKTAHKFRRKVGICGQAPSDFPDFTKFLVNCDIDSISVNPDVAVKTKLLVAKMENKI